MGTIHIPPTFGELEELGDEDLQKIIRMAKAVLNEREPITQAMSHLKNDTPVRSSRIAEAFKSIPTTPVDAEEFAAKHNISVSTLRQQKRFDPLQGEGDERVYVKKSKRDGRLYVWRGSNRPVGEI